MATRTVPGTLTRPVPSPRCARRPDASAVHLRGAPVRSAGVAALSRRGIPGLPALGAAVIAARRDPLARAARAGLVSRDPTGAGRRPPGRVSSRGGRLAPGSVPPARTPGDPDPSGPAAPDGGPTHPDGEAARSLALVHRAQAGDADAFGALYDLYVGMVYRYVRHRVANPELAQDLTAETFLRALRRIGTFTWQGRDIGAWFVTIARNLVADHYKSGRYRLELSTEDVATSAPVPIEPGPEDVVLARLQSADVLEAVRRLKPEQQECISLRFLQGLSVSETAQVMGKNDGAVKALQYRAVRSLARLLPEGVEP